MAGGAGLLLPRSLRAMSAAADPNYFALVSDLHLSADRNFSNHQTPGLPPSNMFANFQQVCGEILELSARPAAVIVNGDVAYHEGLPADYATALAAMKPLREAGLPVHWALGNHDDRTNIAKAAEPDDTLVPELADHRVMVLPTPRANIFVMDTLYETNQAPGRLGPEQLTWLSAALDRHTDLPAIVFVHHNPFLPTPAAVAQASAPNAKPLVNTGLLDTQELLKVLLPRKDVKACIYGHTHRYNHRDIEGLHLVNLPATGYLFAKGPPLGWMDMLVGIAGARLQLHCLDPKHPLQNDVLDLKWRA